MSPRLENEDPYRENEIQRQKGWGLKIEPDFYFGNSF
jgi:hypothetical protein